MPLNKETKPNQTIYQRRAWPWTVYMQDEEKTVDDLITDGKKSIENKTSSNVVSSSSIGINTYILCSWDCRIHWLHLYWGKTLLDDTNQSDNETSVMLDLWGMRSTPSLPSLLDPLWLGVVAPDRILSMDPIELNHNYAQLNCLIVFFR